MQPKFDRKINNDDAWETNKKEERHSQSLFIIHVFSLSYFYIIIHVTKTMWKLLNLMRVKVKFSDKLKVSSGIRTQSVNLLKGRKYASEFQCSFGSPVFFCVKQLFKIASFSCK